MVGQSVLRPTLEMDESESPTVLIPPRQDGGVKAWLFLTAASLTMVITWGACCYNLEVCKSETNSFGFSASFGIFREHYFNNLPYKGNQSVAYIGVLGTVGCPPL